MTNHAPHRIRLPETRPSVTRKAQICGFEVYITVGFYDDQTEVSDLHARPGEVFVKLSKHGSELSGLMDTVSMLMSVALQYGVPWKVIFEKLRHTRFGQADANFTSLCDGLAVHITEMIRERRDTLGLSDEPRDTD